MQTSTYTFRDTEELIAYQEGRYGSYEYGRYGNPTTRAVEEKIRVRFNPDRAAPSMACGIVYLPVVTGCLCSRHQQPGNTQHIFAC